MTSVQETHVTCGKVMVKFAHHKCAGTKKCNL